MEFSILFKTHPPHSPSMEKNKNNIVYKSFLMADMPFIKKKILTANGICLSLFEKWYLMKGI